MPIQYAGVDLLLEDPGGKLCRWLDQYIAVEGMKLFAQPATHIGRDNPRSGVRQFTSLPMPNYPPLPLPKVNALYWPAGAARWSYGLFLTDDEGLDDILTALDAEPYTDSRGNAGLLRIFDADVDPVTIGGVYMYLLPPRKVSAYDGGDANGVWLLPLVDQRYWWQFLQFDGTIESWDELLESIKRTTGLGANLLTDGVDGAYGLPHCVEMAREGDSIGLILDAAAHCIGKRFVLDTRYAANSSSSSSSSSSGGAGQFGGYRLQQGILKSPTAAETQLDANLTTGTAGGIIAGGEFSADNIEMVRPKRVSVIFPDDGKREVGDIKTASADGAVTGTVKTYHEAADTGITDDSWRQALANQLAADLKGWTKRLYDITYAGVVDWRPNGYDNYIEWFVGRRMRNGKFQMQTRVCSMPYNFGVENLAHQQDDECPEADDTGDASGCPCCCKPCICKPDDDDMVDDCSGLELPEEFAIEDLDDTPFAPGGNLAHTSGCEFKTGEFNITLCPGTDLEEDLGDFYWKLVPSFNPQAAELTLHEAGGAEVAKYVNVKFFDEQCKTEFMLATTRHELFEIFGDQNIAFPCTLCIRAIGDECDPCEPGDVTVCGCTLPQTLNMTVTSSCGTVNGAVVPLVWDGVDTWDASPQPWVPGGTCPNPHVEFTFIDAGGGQCKGVLTAEVDGLFALNIESAPFTPGPSTCINIAFPDVGGPWSAFLATCGCGGGTISIVVAP